MIEAEDVAFVSVRVAVPHSVSRLTLASACELVTRALQRLDPSDTALITVQTATAKASIEVVTANLMHHK